MQPFYPSYSRFKVVTKSDTVPVTYTVDAITGDPKAPLVLRKFQALSTGTVGDVAVKTDDGDSVIHYNLAAGIIHPIAGSYIMSTGTEPTEFTVYFA